MLEGQGRGEGKAIVSQEFHKAEQRKHTRHETRDETSWEALSPLSLPPSLPPSLSPSPPLSGTKQNLQKCHRKTALNTEKFELLQWAWQLPRSACRLPLILGCKLRSI